MSRFSHSILRKPGLVSTSAAFPLILRLPEYGPLRILRLVFLAPDIDRLSLFEKGPDAFAEIFRAAAQHLITVFHRNHVYGSRLCGSPKERCTASGTRGP